MASSVLGRVCVHSPSVLLPKPGKVDVSAEFSKEGTKACGETYMMFRRPTAGEHVSFHSGNGIFYLLTAFFSSLFLIFY